MVARFLLIGLCLCLPGAALAADAAPPPSHAAEEFYTPDFGVGGEVRQLKGPKRVIAVGEFNSTGAFNAHFGDWDSGGGIEAIMISALSQTGQFIVVDRAALGQILTEKELAAGGLSGGGANGVDRKQLIAAHLYVVGSITQSDLGSKGSGFSIGIGTGGFGNKTKAGLSPQFRSGKVAMDLRLVDAGTGRVIDSFNVEQKVKDKSVGLTIGYDYASFGTTQFWKTPLGEAMREMVAKAVAKIVEKSEAIPWNAQVVEFSAPVIYVNAGSENGLAVGDELVIRRTVKTFTDPTTGEMLKSREADIGRVRILQVDARLSQGQFTPVSDLAPARGDMVVLDAR